jgi:hypothetical protein
MQVLHISLLPFFRLYDQQCVQLCEVLGVLLYHCAVTHVRYNKFVVISGFAATDSLPRNATIELRSPSIVERLGAMTDRLLERGFVAWGRCTFCTNLIYSASI